MTVYEGIASTIRGKIRSGEYLPGRKFESENELARSFGVARKTLRRALLILETEGLIVRKKKAGTVVSHPGHKIKLGKKVYYFGEYDSHFFKDFFVAMLQEGQSRGIEVTGYDLSKNCIDGLDRRLRIEDSEDALMFVVQSTQLDLFDEVLKKQAHHRTVMLDLVQRGPDSFKSYCVCPDFMRSGLDITEHLIQLGHSRIVFVGANMMPGEEDKAFPRNNPTDGFFSGYLAAMARHGLESPGNIAFLGFDDSSVTRLESYLKSLPELPTAAVCQADFRAVSLLKAAAKMGLKVPDDISVTGAGNTPWCEVCEPELTSISFDHRQIARLIIEVLGSPPPKALVRVFVEPSLVVRKSTEANGTR